MSNPKWEEQIIVVSQEDLFANDLDFQGVHIIDSIQEPLVFALMQNISDKFTIMRRGNEKDPSPKEINAEINKDFKQIIPYCVVRKGNEYFTYKRLSAGGETRLFDKLSIGVGGHANDVEPLMYESVDVNFGLILEDNVLRELNEELFIDSAETQVEVMGVINDDSDSVGEVHFGILVVVDLDEDAIVEVNEKDQLEGEWMTLDKLLEESTFEKMENWSKLTIMALAGG